MPVDLSIKRVPDTVARLLRRRAERHHRSIQGELMAILQEAVAAPAAGASVVRETAAPYSSQPGRRVAPASESALIIRQAREGRTFTISELHRFVSALGTSTADDSTRLIRQGRDSR